MVRAKPLLSGKNLPKHLANSQLAHAPLQMTERLHNAWAAPLRHGAAKSSGSHLFALLRAGEASLGTTLAMVSTMLFAFFATGTADLRANSAQVSSIFAVSSHECCRCPANLCAIHVVLDTASHHLYVIFLETGRRAHVANNSAVATCLDTRLEILIHGFSPLSSDSPP